MDKALLLAYYVVGLVVFYYALVQFRKARGLSLDHIPALGPSGMLTSYLGVPRSLFDSRGLTHKGYQLYPKGLFKIAWMDKWIVFCCNQRYAEDISKASDDQLSNWKALRQGIAMEYTLGPETAGDLFHVGVIRAALNRNWAACFPDIQDEVVRSFNDILVLDGGDWKAVPAMDTMLRLACRVSNRLFVGAPLCRDPDFLDMSMTFTVDVMKTAVIVNLFPRFLQPIVGHLASKLPAYTKRAEKHLSAIILERIKMEEEHGMDWPGKPNDSITWLLEESKGERRSVRNVILRMFMVNFASMHTTSMALTQALYHLAANPEYAIPLREEVSGLVAEHGWTKEAVDRMYKIDSFLRESLRLSPGGSMTAVRLALQDFTFSDGVRIPAGTYIGLPMDAMHHDERRYADPFKFDPNRFVVSAEKDGRRQQQLAMTGADYLTWGVGKHACPGRWFAATKLKTMLAHIVVTYDVMLKEEGGRPPNEWLGLTCMPNHSAEVLFRKRRS